MKPVPPIFIYALSEEIERLNAAGAEIGVSAKYPDDELQEKLRRLS